MVMMSGVCNGCSLKRVAIAVSLVYVAVSGYDFEEEKGMVNRQLQGSCADGCSASCGCDSDGGYGDYDGGYDGGNSGSSCNTCVDDCIAACNPPSSKTFDIQLLISFEDFDVDGMIAALTNSTSAAGGVNVTSVVYVVRAEYTFTAVISDDEAKTIIADIMDVNTSDVNVTISPARRLRSDEDSVTEFLGNRKSDMTQGRRLQGVEVIAEISATNYTLAKSVEALSLDSNATSAALVAALLSQYNKSSEVVVGDVTTLVQIVTVLFAASNESISLETSVLETAIQTMGGALDVVVERSVPTPPPTAPLTAPPTAPPAAPPTTSPTPAPTAAPLMGQPSCTCAMGANALMFVAAVFALQEFA